MAKLAKVNREGRETSSLLLAELALLREAVATHLRYLDGEIVSGLRDGRHDPDTAANIGQHQSRNLRAAVERTGPLCPNGTAGSSLRLSPPTTPSKEKGRG